MKIYNELESLGFFEWLKEKGFGSGFTPIILDAQPFDSIERGGYNAIAFRWFREKYNLYHFVTREIGVNTSDIFFVASFYKGKKGNSPRNTCISSKTYEEAELECLKKLIEIINFK